MADKKIRSVAKTFSWRLFIFIYWVIFGYIFTGSFKGAGILGLGSIIPLFFYYFHERIWNKSNIGRIGDRVKRTRSLIKAFTWRITASLDTFLLSYVITSRFDWATSIAFFEIITKAILYYFHERGWNKIKWGRVY